MPNNNKTVQKRKLGRISSFFKNFKIRRENKQKADFLLIFLLFIITLFGLIMVYDASVVEANQIFADRFHYLKFQGPYFLFGWIILLIVGHIDYHIYKKFISIAFVFNVLLLLLVLFMPPVYGARRWIDLGISTFQPSETFKTILVIYLATWLDKKRTLAQFFLLIGFILGLIILEPDLGTAIVLLASAFILYFVSGADLVKFLFSAVGAGILGLLLIISSPYRMQRLKTFFDYNADSLGSSYHIQQVLIALGSGGLWGLGFGQSIQKYQYLPEASSDSIFAIVGEEVGFAGALILVMVFVIIIYKGIQIAKSAPDKYGQLLALGITSWIGVQFFLNLASMVSLVPLTGVPLPFLSYGGTSLVVCLASMGILLNISKNIEKSK
ncbi:cell division protein FtsW [Candidatus Beckwithbacteria bacterium]|nr:cell division protein FtsW [Candidatus Beckwithbacteria bacterium]